MSSFPSPGFPSDCFYIIILFKIFQVYLKIISFLFYSNSQAKRIQPKINHHSQKTMYFYSFFWYDILYKRN